MIVYWAPVFFDFDNNIDWNMLYYEPKSLYSYHIKNINKENKDKNTNFFYCPPFQNVAQNTFVIENPIHTHITFEQENNGYKGIVKSKNYIETSIVHKPSLKNNLLISYGLQYVFFAEKDLDMMLTSPYFHQANYLSSCSLIPGKFNINKWFRVINLEFNLWQSNELNIQKLDPLAYVNFLTDEKIVLKRFEMNKKLHSYCNSAGSSSTWESFVPLIERYKRFTSTRTNDLVLKEIKKNLL